MVEHRGPPPTTVTGCPRYDSSSPPPTTSTSPGAAPSPRHALWRPHAPPRHHLVSRPRTAAGPRHTRVVRHGGASSPSSTATGDPSSIQPRWSSPVFSSTRARPDTALVVSSSGHECPTRLIHDYLITPQQTNTPPPLHRPQPPDAAPIYSASTSRQGAATTAIASRARGVVAWSTSGLGGGGTDGVGGGDSRPMDSASTRSHPAATG
jgi:hypothetical protein